MDYLFLDTSIYEANNFLEGNRIQQFFKLAEEGAIVILMPKITYHEIRNRLTGHLQAALPEYKKARDNVRILRNVPSLTKNFPMLKRDQVVQELLDTFDQQLNKSKVVFINFPEMETAQIFERYFSNQFPFGKGEKKHEFPDAFALASVELWSKENGHKAFILSNDKDILNYKSDNVRVVQHYDAFLDRMLRRITIANKNAERLAIVKQRFSTEYKNLEAQVEDWVRKELSGKRAYSAYTHIDIHDIDIQVCEASLSDYQLVRISNTDILLETQAKVYLRVEIEIDDESTGIYDDEERQWYYVDTINDIIDESLTLPVILKADFPVAGDEYMTLVVDQVNNGADLRLR